MRIENTIRNMKYGYIFNFVSILLNFITRAIFIKYLTAEFLGASGLFSNILTILSFADLGIGTAITYSLYKPLANQDTETIKGLVRLFGKCYTIIAVVVLFVGMGCIPFLPILTNHSTLPNLNLIYFLYLLSTVFSYLFADKKSLLFADQKDYIISKTNTLFQIIQAILQIFSILYFKSFIAYLSVQIGIQVISSVRLYLIVKKDYPYLFIGKAKPLDKGILSDLIRNIRALLMHKMGSVVVNGTDNIIISSALGLVKSGVYSNYLMIVSTVRGLVSQIYSSATASIGNLNSQENESLKLEIFYKLDFLYYSLFYFSAILIAALSSPLINLLNSDYVVENNVLLCIVLNYTINGLRVCVNQFKETSGLYWYDRYKPVIEGLVNLVVSLYLVKKIGLLGVLLGTSVCSLCVGMWYEEKIAFNKIFKLSFIPYFFTNLVRITLIMLVSSALVYMQSMFRATVLSFIMLGIFSFIIETLIYLVIYRKNIYFIYYVDFAMSYFKKIVNHLGRNVKKYE